MQTKQTGTLVDDVDREILGELRKNCRRSFRALGKVLGLSPATLIERVRRLEAAGYIMGYSANLNFLKLGYEFMGIVKITISGGALLDVQQKISRLKGVAAVYDATGDYDSIAIVLCKSRSDLSRLAKGILSIPHVEKTNTSMVLNVVKDFYEFNEA
ncbi:MAG: Lrp/AsnC family transcriptional regulator [Candidatus Burarchaeum sp.]|nr:Lrp/AsnC family transcriptional regulator [Candidatus Burarchaeum sp.]MDO8339864.1 Lrp/AsnC family transcriptional regulator [Candidatus Burarchaeum sp.]